MMAGECVEKSLTSDTPCGKRTKGTCKVAHLHSTLGIYGAERWTLALIKHLDINEFETIVISIGTKPGADSFHRLLLSEGFQTTHIRIPGKLNPRAVLKLHRLLQELDVDILHTHGFKSDVLGYLATRSLRVGLVSTVHGWSADEGLRIKSYEAIGRIFLKQFDRVYPLSPALLQYLQERAFDPLRLRLVLNGVDLSGIQFKFNVRRPGDPFSILFAGRVCRPKGVFDLLQAFAQAKFDVPANLVFVGDGYDLSSIVELSRKLGVENRVRCVGAAPSISPFLAESHAVVLPSYSEGIPRVLMEAFAAGVPVVGTAIPGIRQLVNDGVNGILVPVGAPPVLARALERLCRDPDMANRMANAAHDTVVEKYSAQRMAQDFKIEYQQLC